MNDEIRNKAVELTDKEMNQVVGGTGLTCWTTFPVNGVGVDCNQVLCEAEFRSRYYEGEQNSCASHNSASSNNNAHCCESCKHFHANVGYIWQYVTSQNANGSGPDLPSGGGGSGEGLILDIGNILSVTGITRRY